MSSCCRACNHNTRPDPTDTFINIRYSLMKTNHLLVALVLGGMMTSTQAGSFDKGSITATAAIGSTQFFREDYLVLGIGAGYFIADGLQIGMDLDYWSGGDPTIYEITPKINYIYDAAPGVKPYLGAFFNRTFIHKMAIVADEKWRDQAAMFTMQGLRPFPIEFFTSETEARQWLDG